MPSMRTGGFWRLSKFILVALIGSGMLAMQAPAAAFAQMQRGNPPIVIPQTQGGSTLEVPTVPGSQTTRNLPPPPPSQQELIIPSRQLRQQPGYKQVTVTVTNRQGGYVTGLNKSDFRLYLNGQQSNIQFFRQDLNTPVSVGIVVDTSGSMEPKLAQARLAIAQFLRDLNDRDDVFLIAFSSRPFLLQPFTTDHRLVMSRLALLHAYGQTSLFDAILEGLLMVQHGRYDKRALLVVTDGMDNTSVHSLNQVAARARQEGVLVYSIGIGDPNASSAPTIVFGPFAVGGDVERVDARTLYSLSSETGAKTFIIRRIGDGDVMRRACANISTELREQYTIGFVAPDPGAAGYRSLRVEVPSRPGDSVRVRKGVAVGKSSPPPASYAGP
jgi:Ca-activated chloride channel homolog